MKEGNKSPSGLISELEKLRRHVSEIHELRKFKTICDRAGYGVVIRDLKGNFVYLNDCFAKMHGYAPEELRGKHYSIVHTPEQVEHVESLETIRKRRGGFVAEIWHKRKDGTVFPTLMNGTMLKDDNGNHLYNTATAIDISELKIKNRNLEEVNAALRVLLRKRDSDKLELEEKVLYNVKELVKPVLEKLKKSGLDKRQQAYINILESSLNDIVSPFARRLSQYFIKLTPTEIQIANLIREGKTTKEIAEFMTLSMRTIEFHRKNIRNKFGIKNKKENLRSHLLSLH